MFMNYLVLWFILVVQMGVIIMHTLSKYFNYTKLISHTKLLHSSKDMILNLFYLYPFRSFKHGEWYCFNDAQVTRVRNFWKF